MVIGKLAVTLGLQSAQFHAGMAAAGNTVRNFRQTVTGSVSTLSTLAATVGRVTVIVGALYAVLGAARPAYTFEQAMASSTAIMGELSQEMRQTMAQTAKEVATNTKFSAEETAGAYYELASAGMNAAQAVAALPQVAMFAQAGMFDLATATRLAVTAQNALGLSAKDPEQNLANLTRVTDVLTAANNMAMGTVEDFATALTTKAGAAARIVGMDIEEVVAVLAAFANAGTLGEEAGTQFAMVLRDLQTKSIENAAAFAANGVKVYDSAGNMRAMADILADLENRLSGMSDETQKATLLQMGFADRSLHAMMTLLGQSEQIREYEAKLRQAGGTTAEVAEKQLPAFTRGLHQVWQLIKRLSMVIFVPILEALGQALLALTPILEGVVYALETASNGMANFFARLKRDTLAAFGIQTAKAGEEAAKAAPKVDAMGDAAARMNALIGDTADQMNRATSAAEEFRRSLEEEIQFQGLDGVRREFAKLEASDAWTLGKDRAGTPIVDFEAWNATREAMEAVLEMERKQEIFAERTREHQEAMSRGTSMTQALETPLEAFKRRIADANHLVELGAIGWETYTREIAAAREELVRLQGQAQGPALIEAGSQAAYAAMAAWEARAAARAAMPAVPMPDLGAGPASRQPRIAAPTGPAVPDEVIRFGPRPKPSLTDSATNYVRVTPERIAAGTQRSLDDISRKLDHLETIAGETGRTTDASRRTAQAVERIQTPEVVEM